MSERYDRNVRFFGREGQLKLATATVAVVGVGGIGTHVVQQLALLGVGNIVLIDSEELDATNLNRYVGVRRSDPIPGTLKVAVGDRLVRETNPEADAIAVAEDLQCRTSFEQIIACDYVFGCVDKDGPRLILTELCSAYENPYFDLATDICDGGQRFGGRVFVTWDGNGCLFCRDVVDLSSANDDLMSDEAKRNRDKIYGVDVVDLGEAGPSVVSINGIIASVGVTEFMLAVTGLVEEPRRHLTYRGHMGTMAVSTDVGDEACYFCREIRGRGNDADVFRYVSELTTAMR